MSIRVNSDSRLEPAGNTDWVLVSQGGDENEGQGSSPFAAEPAQVVLPDEVWSMIFGHMKGYKGLESCFRVCRRFNRLLGPVKRTFLFGKVFPLLRAYLSEWEVLACRKTCSAWCDAVDTDLRTRNELTPFDGLTWYGQVDRRMHVRGAEMSNPVAELSAPSRRLCARGIWMKAVSRRTVDNMTRTLTEELLQRPPPAPVLGRAIIISRFISFRYKCRRDCTGAFPSSDYYCMHRRDELFRYDLEEEYWQKVFLWLEVCGGNVWHANLMGHSRFCPFSVTTCLNNLQRCLNLLPNLRSFQFYAEQPNDPVLPDVRQLIANLKLPKLVNLQSLILPSFDYWRESTWAPLRKYLILQHASTLKRLDVGYVKDLDLPPHMPNFCSLKELNISGDGRSTEDVELFLASFRHSPIQCLSLTCVRPQTFALINQFGATLHKLTVHRIKLQLNDGENLEYQQCCLPNLLVLQYNGNEYLAVLFDILSGNTGWGNKDPERICYKFNRDKQSEIVFKSPIWNSIKSLQQITWACFSLTRHFTRKQYDYFNRANGVESPVTDNKS